VANNSNRATYKHIQQRATEQYETNTSILTQFFKKTYGNQLRSILTNLSVIISLLKTKSTLQTEYARKKDVKITNNRKIYVCYRFLSNDNKPCGFAQVKVISL
jgi:hypothetical protein